MASQAATCVAPDTVHSLLHDVDKPARYTGGELNSVVKPSPVRARAALCFPDVYEVAESHIGLKILYKIINDSPEFAAERVYAQWPDLEQRARAQDVPLWSLETYRPLHAFDMVGFTLQYELSYPTIITMLQQGRIPPRASARDAHHPYVIGGGAGAYNPEPIAPFFDAFLLGDGEEAVIDLMELIGLSRENGWSREHTLDQLSRIPGIYVPSLFELAYDGVHVKSIQAKPGSVYAQSRSKHHTPRVPRRTVVDIDKAPYPTAPIVPNVKPIHDRVSIEIQRGCSQSCRFCQAGMITRPTRQRKPQTVLKLADDSLQNTGSSEVGLLSLSAGDYEPINEVLAEFFGRYKEERIAIGLPSMRTETMTPELAQQVAQVKKSGFTFAPEAGSERMRRVINKTNSEQDLMNAVRATVNAGWRLLKFYFMIGLPTETDEDVDAIVHLAKRARDEGRKINRAVNVTVSVSTFVPKPHTSFQWEQQISVEETYRKHQRLRSQLRKYRINFRYHSPEQSYLEGVLSRGDRRLADALELAASRGARLDAWGEHHDNDRWLSVLDETLKPHGLTADDWLVERCEKQLLPWDHLDAGILKKFLQRDRHRSYQEGTIDDCAFSHTCTACGGCDVADPYLARKNAQGKRDVVLQPITHQESPERTPTNPVPLARENIDAIVARSRVKFRYAKVGRAVHLSQLDAMDQILRAVRQAKMPVLYTQGHHPRPRIGFSPAVPTGIGSNAEYFEVDCRGYPDSKSYAEKINGFLPDGLHILEADDIPWETPALNSLLESILYVVTYTGDTTSWEKDIAAFKQASSVAVQVLRKGKPRVLEAKEAIGDVSLVGAALHLRLNFFPGGTLKVREALAAIIGLEQAFSVTVRKESIVLADMPISVDRGVRRITEDVPAIDVSSLSDRRVAPKKPVAKSTTVPYAE